MTLAPLALIAYMVILEASHGDPFAFAAAQAGWECVAASFAAVALGLGSGLIGIAAPFLVLFGGDGFVGSGSGRILVVLGIRNVILFGILRVGIRLTIEAAGRLPMAYWVNVVAAPTVPLSAPGIGEPAEVIAAVHACPLPALDRARRLGCRARQGPSGHGDRGPAATRQHGAIHDLGLSAVIR